MLPDVFGSWRLRVSNLRVRFLSWSSRVAPGALVTGVGAAAEDLRRFLDSLRLMAVVIADVRRSKRIKRGRTRTKEDDLGVTG